MIQINVGFVLGKQLLVFSSKLSFPILCLSFSISVASFAFPFVQSSAMTSPFLIQPFLFSLFVRFFLPFPFEFQLFFAFFGSRQPFCFLGADFYRIGFFGFEGMDESSVIENFQSQVC